jgi:hypothetical protein
MTVFDYRVIYIYSQRMSRVLVVVFLFIILDS